MHQVLVINCHISCEVKNKKTKNNSNQILNNYTCVGYLKKDICNFPVESNSKRS